MAVWTKHKEKAKSDMGVNVSKKQGVRMWTRFIRLRVSDYRQTLVNVLKGILCP
jgi:hypothetical protein